MALKDAVAAGGTWAGVAELRLEATRPDQLSQWEALDGLRRSGLFCDVIIRCAGGEVHKAHAAVLAAASTRLREALEPLLTETAGRSAELSVEVSGDAVRTALDFIYSGSASSRQRLVPDLVRLAKRWELKVLQATLASSLTECFTPEIVAGLFALGENIGAQLGAAARAFALGNVGACAETEAFGRWPPAFLENVLRSSDLSLRSEEEALVYLLRWCAAAPGRGSEVFPLGAVRWPLLSLPTLESLAECRGAAGSLRGAVAAKAEAAIAVHRGLEAATSLPLRKSYAGWWASLGCSTAGVSILAGRGAEGKAGKEELAPRAVRPHEGTFLFLDSSKEPGRVLQWFLRAQSGRSVAGAGSDVYGDGADFEDIADVWSGPGGSLFVLDRDMERVVRLRSGEAEVVQTGKVKLKGPCAVAADGDGAVYVLDCAGARVLRVADGRAAVVAGSVDAGTGPAHLNAGPTGRIFVADRRLYVADTMNHRVQRWDQGAREGVTVAGGHGCGAAANQLNHPAGIWVLENGTLLVADTGNHRVMRWRDGGLAGVVAAGGCGAGDALHQLKEPVDVVVEPASGALLVADLGNRRVTRWAAMPPPQELLALRQ